MEIKLIEVKTFHRLKDELNSFSSKVKTLCQKHGKIGMDNWLDNQDVCFLFKISPRTLQSYRDAGKISFSQINHKIYYRSSDIEKLLQLSNKKIR